MLIKSDGIKDIYIFGINFTAGQCWSRARKETTGKCIVCFIYIGFFVNHVLIRQYIFYVNHVLIRQYIFYVNHVLTITILSVVRIFVSNLSILTPKAKRSWRDDCDFQCLLGCGCTEIYNSNFTFNMVLFSPGRGSGYHKVIYMCRPVWWPWQHSTLVCATMFTLFFP